MTGGHIGNLGNYRSITEMFGAPMVRRTGDEWGTDDTPWYPEWTSRRACIGIRNDEMVPPINYKGNTTATGRESWKWRVRATWICATVCTTCPVCTECGAYGDQLDEVGVYGGRIRLRAKR